MIGECIVVLDKVGEEVGRGDWSVGRVFSVFSRSGFRRAGGR